MAHRGHAVRLLGTLRTICRRLRKLQSAAAGRAAYGDVERKLAALEREYRR